MPTLRSYYLHILVASTGKVIASGSAILLTEMASTDRLHSVLLGLTGMQIEGGIACVARCVAQAMDDGVSEGRLERVDRVLLHDRVATAAAPVRGAEEIAGSSQTRFVWRLWRTFRRHRHDLLFFDHYGLARALELPLPGFSPARHAIFTHAFELLPGRRLHVLQRASRLLANSEYSARVLRERVSGVEVRPVHLCVDPARERAWSIAGIPDPAASREPVVLIVARMAEADERGKGHDALLEAWPAVLEAVPAARLWIAGRGDDAERLRGKAGRLGLTENVRFLGQVGSRELTELYRRAAVYAMPSRREGFGIAFAEAMWHGLPCIGSTADAAREVIVDGVTGRLVSFGDAVGLTDVLRQLLIDSELRVSMGTAGFNRVRQQFSYEHFRHNLAAALGLADGH